MAEPPPLVEARVAMLRRGLSVTEAAERLGCSRSHLSGVLAGLKPMPPTLARDLAALLDLHAHELLRRKEAVKP